MSHNAYFAGWAGSVSDGHVPDGTEYTLLWNQLYASINGDDGGTWAPGAFITVGGSGFSLTGTGHRIAASARLNVESTGEIRIKDGATLKLDGAAGDILAQVISNVATLTAQTGTVIKVEAGGALDVYGGLTLKNTSGPGSLTAEANTLISLSSGATMTAASGSTVNLTGDANVRGTLTIKASGGPGSLVQENGTATIFGGAVSLASTAIITYSSGAEVNGLITRKGAEVRDGSSARTAKRPIVTLSASADGDITVAADDYRVPQTLTGSRVYTIRHTGTVPKVGEEIWVYRTGTTTPSAHTAQIAREDGTVIAAFFNSKQGSFRLVFDGTDWQCVGGGQYASGDTDCGYYDNVW